MTMRLTASILATLSRRRRMSPVSTRVLLVVPAVPLSRRLTMLSWLEKVLELLVRRLLERLPMLVATLARLKVMMIERRTGWPLERERVGIGKDEHGCIIGYRSYGMTSQRWCQRQQAP